MLTLLIAQSAFRVPSLREAIILILVIAVLGVCFTLLKNSTAIAEPFKTAITIIAVIVLIAVVLSVFGIL